MTILFIILLVIIIGLLYKQYRQKQLNNQLITDKNIILNRLLTEKDWLLKEVHHRVKNNLHTIICLLESQAYYLENDALKAIEVSQNRIYAMSLIHQKLYQSEDIKTIDMAIYLAEFIDYLSDSFDTHAQITFQLNVEQLKLGVAQAIPLALIINEAVTNSIKYAFPEKRKGIIDITLKSVQNKTLLIIKDDGIGINPALNHTELNSLGIELMKGLSTDLNGEISIENDNGTKIIVKFDQANLSSNPDAL